MLSEYRHEISELKQKDAHFTKIFEKHNELDETIRKAEEGEIAMSDPEIETLKKEKLLLKDEALMMILRYKKSKEEG
ncbi:YdcH family protein [Nitratifractor sp.]